MKRRDFLIRIGSLAVWIPATRLLVGCSGDGESGPPSLTFTSSFDDGHSHRVSLEVASIETPPGSGEQLTTNEVSGHVHTVVLTEEDLLAIRDNGTVTKTTSVDVGHSHVFTFRRSAGTPTGGRGNTDRAGGY